MEQGVIHKGHIRCNYKSGCGTKKCAWHAAAMLYNITSHSSSNCKNNL